MDREINRSRSLEYPRRMRLSLLAIIRGSGCRPRPIKYSYFIGPSHHTAPRRFNKQHNTQHEYVGQSNKQQQPATASQT